MDAKFDEETHDCLIDRFVEEKDNDGLKVGSHVVVRALDFILSTLAKRLVAVRSINHRH